jgi:hypothetical protein
MDKVQDHSNSETYIYVLVDVQVVDNFWKPKWNEK